MKMLSEAGVVTFHEAVNGVLKGIASRASYLSTGDDQDNLSSLTQALRQLVELAEQYGVEWGNRVGSSGM